MTLRRVLCFTPVLLALVVLCAPALAATPQNSAANPPSKQSLLLSGTVSEKGAVLLCAADQRLYRVLNSETLRHLEGQLVTLKARFLPEKGQLYVIAVRAESSPATGNTFHLDDAAFRR